jgi:hypothetical protein
VAYKRCCGSSVAHSNSSSSGATLRYVFLRGAEFGGCVRPVGPTCRRRIDRTGPTVQRQNGRWQNMSEAERQATIAVLISSRDKP